MDFHGVLNVAIEVMNNPQKMVDFMLTGIPFFITMVYQITIMVTIALSFILGPLCVISYGLRRNEQALGTPFFAMVGLFISTYFFPQILQTFWNALNIALKDINPAVVTQTLNLKVLEIGVLNLHNAYLSLGVCSAFLLLAVVLDHGRNKQKDTEESPQSTLQKINKKTLESFAVQGINYSLKINQPLFVFSIAMLSVYSMIVWFASTLPI